MNVPSLDMFLGKNCSYYKATTNANVVRQLPPIWNFSSLEAERFVDEATNFVISTTFILEMVSTIQPFVSYYVILRLLVIVLMVANMGNRSSAQVSIARNKMGLKKNGKLIHYIHLCIKLYGQTTSTQVNKQVITEARKVFTKKTYSVWK